MSEMVERVAIAIFKTDCAQGGHHNVDWNDAEDWEQKEYREQARDAIEAMREPTDKMVYEGGYREESVRETWRAMIDAALHE